MIKSCKKCNKEFNPRSYGQIYCSSKCAKPILKKIDLKCSHCHKEFQKYPSQVKPNKDTVFCGNKCVIDYRKLHWNAKIGRLCIECGKEFKIYQSEINKCKGAGKYCSKSCQANGHVIKECPTCNKEFKAYKSNIERGGDIYCSKRCFNNRTDPIEYFFDNISYKNNGCWEWRGRKDKDGYGVVTIKNNVRAHRLSWEYHNKSDAGEKLICHKCDNPPCVNPDHLYSGTFKDNAQDKIDKTRHKI